ncbi:hypothetical protein B0O99DRAFT_690048 [Bisporella sp. PMI_857]|nr:hypothetical protein B0O99DRAFT_690048 [Bisporella sp. PMI_857]
MLPSALLSCALFTAFACAQNPFSFATLPQSIPVGQQFNITWIPTTGATDTITLVLRQGNPLLLDTVGIIAANLPNTGFYLWTPSSWLVNGPQYALEIISENNTGIRNYSGQFAISSQNTAIPGYTPSATPSLPSSSSLSSESSASFLSVTSASTSQSSVLTTESPVVRTSTKTATRTTKSAVATTTVSSYQTETGSGSVSKVSSALLIVLAWMVITM